MQCNQSTCHRLWTAAKECRDAQRQYFKTRDTSDLKRAKACEKALDNEIIHFNRVVNYDGSIPAPIAINQPDFFESGREFHHDPQGVIKDLVGVLTNIVEKVVCGCATKDCANCRNHLCWVKKANATLSRADAVLKGGVKC